MEQAFVLGARSRLAPITAAVPCFALAGGCSRPPAQAPLRIGIISAAEAEDQWHIVATARLAVDRANDRGRLPFGAATRWVELVVADSGDTIEGSMNAAQRLINREGVAAFVGPYDTREAVPVSRLAEQAGIPMISPGSTSPETTAGKRCIFRACNTDAREGQTLADFARRRIGARSAAVLYDAAQEYSRSLAQAFRREFEAAGGRIVAFESGTTDQQDFGLPLARIRAARPEILFLPGEAGPALRQAQQARALGIRVPLLGSDGWDYRSFTQRPEFDGAFAASHWRADSDRAETRAFVEAYEASGGGPPEEVQALTWDAVNLLLEAARRAPTATPASICAALRGMGEFRGATGVMRYGSGGDPEKTVHILQFRNGGFGPADSLEPGPPVR